MKNYKIILALDPSGAFYEGKGTTGWHLFDAIQMQPITTGFISAKDFSCMEQFWEEHIVLIEKYRKCFGKDLIVVIEDYLLYAHKTADQINSRMETPKLLGVLQHYCWSVQQAYYMQTASEVKHRWTDDILAYKGYFIPKNRGYALCSNPQKTINRHCKDAVRHAVHYAHFKNKEDK